MTSPEVSLSKPEIIFKTVDLPQPDGPTMQKNPLFSTSNVKASNALAWSKILKTLLKEIMGSAMAIQT